MTPILPVWEGFYMGKCNECRFMQDAELNDAFEWDGKCFRYPPTLVVVDGEVCQLRPNVKDMDSCGEWSIDDKVFRDRVSKL